MSLKIMINVLKKITNDLNKMEYRRVMVPPDIIRYYNTKLSGAQPIEDELKINAIEAQWQRSKTIATHKRNPCELNGFDSHLSICRFGETIPVPSTSKDPESAIWALCWFLKRPAAYFFMGDKKWYINKSQKEWIGFKKPD